MRLLTHNSLTYKKDGFPLRITSAQQVRVDDPAPMEDRQMEFLQHTLLPTLNWPALVQGASELGIHTLPPTLTEEMVQDKDFLTALHHILFHVHLVQGTLSCPVTGRTFAVEHEIPNFMLEEDECD